MHLLFSSCSYAQRDLPWEATFEQMPADVTADVPVPGGGNQWHQDCFGMGECHIENKIFTMDRRVMGFWDTGLNRLLSLSWFVMASSRLPERRKILRTL